MRQFTRLLKARPRLSVVGQLKQCSDWSYKPVSIIDPPTLPNSVWALRRYLNYHPEGVLEYLDLEPNLSLSTYSRIKVGRKGSLSVGIEDTLSGWWFNFETGQHGDMLDLIQQYKNLTEDEAVSLARSLMNDQYFDKPLEPQAKPTLKPQILKPNIEAFVARIISECEPITGSLAEEYLVETRGLKDLPNLHNIKYHPSFPTRTSEGSNLKTPCLVTVASHPKSNISNIQVTFLDPKTADKRKDVLVAKRSFGSFKTGDYYNFCTISQSDQLGGNKQEQFDSKNAIQSDDDVPNSFQSNDAFSQSKQSDDTFAKSGQSEVTFISEGIETGLSLFQVRPDSHILATLGKSNILHLDPAILGRKVVLIWDNDGVGLQSDRILLKTARSLQEAGKKLYLLMPAAIPGRSTTDLNDVLRALGREGVANTLRNSMKIEIQ